MALAPSVASRPEATLGIRVLRGCQACGTRHPLAIDPTADPSRCLTCHAPLPPLDDGQIVPAVLTGVRVTLGRALMAIGRFLHRRLNP